VQRLIDLAKNPERIREIMSDPDRLTDLMRSMESEQVQAYFRDPQRVQELMSQIDLGQIREVVRSVDMAKVRKAMAARWKQRLKEQLKATDEEWLVLEPKIDKLIRAQQETRAGIRGGQRAGFGGGPSINAPPPPPVDSDTPSEVQEAAEDVREAAADPDLPGAEVSRRLATYRKARDKAREKLDAAEQELRDVLTQRQEAVLTLAGMLR
jgi:hypothetical protein